MPEIRIGAGNNLDDIQIGATQVEEVRLGPTLVWRNNEAPMFSNVTLGGTPVTFGLSYSTLRNTNTTVSFTLQELESDIPYNVSMTVGGVEVGTTVVNTVGGSGSISISAEALGGATAPAGVLDAPITILITAVDSVGSSQTFRFFINELTVVGGSVSTNPSNRTVTISNTQASNSQTWTYSYVLPNSGANLTVSAGGSVTASATCGNNDSESIPSGTITSSIPGGTLSPVTIPGTTVTLRSRGTVSQTSTANVVVASGANFTVSPSSVSTTYSGLCPGQSAGGASGTVTLTANSGFFFSNGSTTRSYSVPNTSNGGTHTIPANTGGALAAQGSTITLVDSSSQFDWSTSSPITIAAGFPGTTGTTTATITTAPGLEFASGDSSPTVSGSPTAQPNPTFTAGTNTANVDLSYTLGTNETVTLSGGSATVSYVAPTFTTSCGASETLGDGDDEYIVDFRWTGGNVPDPDDVTHNIGNSPTGATSALTYPFSGDVRRGRVVVSNIPSDEAINFDIEFAVDDGTTSISCDRSVVRAQAAPVVNWGFSLTSSNTGSNTCAGGEIIMRFRVRPSINPASVTTITRTDMNIQTITSCSLTSGTGPATLTSTENRNVSFGAGPLVSPLDSGNFGVTVSGAPGPVARYSCGVAFTVTDTNGTIGGSSSTSRSETIPFCTD